MTLLRPRTARAIARYPAEPVVYRRPVICACLAFFYGAFAAALAWISLVPPDASSDRLFPGDWWLPVFGCVVLGPLYLYGTSRLVVDATHVHVMNPAWQADVPLGHVVGVVPGGNLRIATRYTVFAAWGVEGANAQVLADSHGTQDDLAGLIVSASLSAENADDPPAAYRVRPPDAFFWAVAALYLVVLVLVVTGRT